MASFTLYGRLLTNLCYARRATNGVWSSPYNFATNNGSLLTRLTLDEDRNLHIIYGSEYDERLIRRRCQRQLVARP
jgi:hypothetical protein